MVAPLTPQPEIPHPFAKVRHDGTLIAPPLTIQDAARFWSYVEPEPNTGCWLWSGAVDVQDRGRFGWGPRVHRLVKLAHHIAFWLARQQNPAFLCHTCDHPTCVNPDHLYEGNQRQNMKDRNRRGRARWGSSKLIDAIMDHGQIVRLEENTDHVLIHVRVPRDEIK